MRHGHIYLLPYDLELPAFQTRYSSTDFSIVPIWQVTKQIVNALGHLVTRFRLRETRWGRKENFKTLFVKKNLS